MVVYKNPPNQSKGILDDFAVRKNVATREGTIEKTPVNDNDIANKKYVDDNEYTDADATAAIATEDKYLQNTGDTGTGDYNFTGNVNIANTTSSSVGVLTKGGADFLHDFAKSGTTGRNIFMGINSGNFDFTGATGDEASNLVGIGRLTLRSNTTGYLNTAIGSTSLQNCTTGNRNTGIAASSLNSVTTGQQNFGMGYGSANGITEGSYNIAIGSPALQGITDGNSNIAIGNWSLNAGNGNRTIGIGQTAGRYLADGSTQVTGLINGVYLGHDARAGAVNANTEIVIGRRAEGHGSYTATIGGTDQNDCYIEGMAHDEGCFAEIYLADGSTAQTISSSATYSKFTGFTNNGNQKNCTADQANDKITLTKTGYYKVTCVLNGYVDTANIQFDAAIFLDGTIQNNIKSYVEFVAVSKDQEITISGIIDNTTANKDVDVRIRQQSGGDVDATMVNANLNVEYLGET